SADDDAIGATPGLTAMNGPAPVMRVISAVVPSSASSEPPTFLPPAYALQLTDSRRVAVTKSPLALHALSLGLHSSPRRGTSRSRLLSHLELAPSSTAGGGRAERRAVARLKGSNWTAF